MRSERRGNEHVRPRGYYGIAAAIYRNVMLRINAPFMLLNPRPEIFFSENKPLKQLVKNIKTRFFAIKNQIFQINGNDTAEGYFIYDLTHLPY